MSRLRDRRRPETPLCSALSPSESLWHQEPLFSPCCTSFPRQVTIYHLVI